MTDSSVVRRGQKRQGSPAIAAVIDTYSPREIDSEVWAVIGDAARDAVGQLPHDSKRSARADLWIVAQFLAFAHSKGLSVDVPDGVFRPEVVERYLASLEMPRTSARTHRNRLMHVARTATTTAPWPPVPVRVPRSEYPTPYTAHEVACLLHAVNQQVTPQRAELLYAVLTMGFGFGVAGGELQAVRGSSLAIAADGSVTATVGNGWRLRKVTCIASWEGHAALVAAHFGDNRVASQGRVNGLLHKVTVDVGTPRPNLMRCRATWLLTHLTLATPLAVLLPAAGMRSPSRLETLLVHVPAIDPETARTAQRGVAS